MKIKLETINTYALFGKDTSSFTSFNTPQEVKQFFSPNKKAQILNSQTLKVTDEYPATENPDDGYNSTEYLFTSSKAKIQELYNYFTQG